MVIWAREKTAEMESRLVELMRDPKMRMYQAAEALDVSRDWVERRCRKLGIKRKRGSLPREENPAWRGGRTFRKGYRYVLLAEHPNATKAGYVAEHRLVMEAKLGRYLSKKEVVHHRDGNPLNNHPDNLEVFGSNGDHLRHELTGRCPNWTEEGLRRMRVGILKSAAIRSARARGDDPPPRTKSRPSS